MTNLIIILFFFYPVLKYFPIGQKKGVGIVNNYSSKIVEKRWTKMAKYRILESMSEYMLKIL